MDNQGNTDGAIYVLRADPPCHMRMLRTCFILRKYSANGTFEADDPLIHSAYYMSIGSI